jgi:hypothetical protein
VNRFLLRCTFTAACVALCSSAAFGQSDSTAVSIVERSLPTMLAPVMPLEVSGPAIRSSAAEPSFALRPVNEDVSTVVRRRAAFSRPAVLMITGGALLLTGLLVDGDASSILIIAGAGIGGYGLYLHLQSPNARMGR